MSSLKIRKVGNSLGVIFSKEIQETLKISEGDIIDVTPLGGQKIIFEPQVPHHSQWKFKDSTLSPEDKEWVEADLEDHDESSGW